VVVDFDTGNSPSQLVECVRASRSNHGAVIFAAVSSGEQSRAAFRSGATMSIDKPPSVDAMRQCLRAAHGIMVRERRRYFRQPVDITAMADINGHWNPVKIINIGDSGLAIHSSLAVPIGTPVRIRYRLADADLDIACAAIAVWSGADGVIGLRVSDIDRKVEQRLSCWLSDLFEMQLGTTPLSVSAPA
jgi:hypothetical protein